MEPLVIVGAGGFGRETLTVVEAINQAARRYEFLGFLDDGEPRMERLSRLGATCIGTTDVDLPRGTRYAIAVGMNTAVRQELDEKLGARGLVACPPIVHPGANLGTDVSVGDGSIICFGVSITTNVRIGRHVHINPNASIGHDCRIGDYVTVCPSAIVGGEAVIEDGAILGSGANVLPGLKVGAAAMVGAAALVTRDVPNCTTVKGVPAR